MNRIAMLIVSALSITAAWSWQGSRGDARLAELRGTYDREAIQALATLARQHKDAEDRADRIDREAATRNATLEQRLQETQHALKTATRGRPCLGGPALRVLGESPGLRLAPVAPAPAGAPDGGPRPAAADPADDGEYATDADVAEWIAAAGKRYEQCRGQLGDIRDFEDGAR